MSDILLLNQRIKDSDVEGVRELLDSGRINIENIIAYLAVYLDKDDYYLSSEMIAYLCNIGYFSVTKMLIYTALQKNNYDMFMKLIYVIKDDRTRKVLLYYIIRKYVLEPSEIQFTLKVLFKTLEVIGNDIIIDDLTRFLLSTHSLSYESADIVMYMIFRIIDDEKIKSIDPELLCKITSLCLEMNVSTVLTEMFLNLCPDAQRMNIELVKPEGYVSLFEENV